MKVIVDTNVVIDALVCRTPWNKAAEKIFLLAASCRGEYYITANVVTDIYYLIRKHYKDRENAVTIMNKLLQLFMIYDTTARDCINALHCSSMPDYEDAILAEIAKRNQVDYIVTRNVKDFKDTNVEVLTPEEFLEVLNREK